MVLKKKKEFKVEVRNKAMAEKRAAGEIEHQEKVGTGLFSNQTRRQSTCHEAKENKALERELVRKTKELQLREACEQNSIGYQ